MNKLSEHQRHLLLMILDTAVVKTWRPARALRWRRNYGRDGDWFRSHAAQTSRSLRRLEQRGLVVRNMGANGRTETVQLTPAGGQLAMEIKAERLTLFAKNSGNPGNGENALFAQKELTGSMEGQHDQPG